MLVTIRIKNLALVEDLSLELDSGFNAITGETGAGKSILMSALSLTLGERADRDWIRSGTESCTVEAVFDIQALKSLPELLETLGVEPCQDSQLILKRVFNVTGTNKQFINGSPSTLQVLKKIGEELVDMHGPHDHQSLLRPDVQLRILDRFAGLEKMRLLFADQLKKWQEVEDRKKELVMDEAEFHRQLELLQHQVQEIDAARISPDEQEKLEEDYGRASNAQKLVDLIQRAQNALSEGEGNAETAFSQAQRALAELSRIDPASKSFEETCHSLGVQLQEFARDIALYASKIDMDPERLQALSEKMTLIQGLKRKYGKDIPEVLQYAEVSRKKLQLLQGREEFLARLEKEGQMIWQSMEKAGKSLRQDREKAISKLSQTAAKHLKELGFIQSIFEAELKPVSPTPLGMDELEFRFAPNPGEPTQPLREIASSGEMARVMLALKTALADQDEVPLLVFDEVDANVGGEIGIRVGEKMADIGRKHQVLCITHLPQVAVHASSHYLVSKCVEKGRTYTNISRLKTSERTEEVARMLGGKTNTSLKHAKEMLSKGKSPA